MLKRFLEELGSARLALSEVEGGDAPSDNVLPIPECLRDRSNVVSAEPVEAEGSPHE